MGGHNLLLLVDIRLTDLPKSEGAASHAILLPAILKVACGVEIVMNELRRFKHSADFLANSSHIIESAAISAS